MWAALFLQLCGCTARAIADEPLDVLEHINGALVHEWNARGQRPADRADDRTVLRRLHLALIGAPPSLEELRRFESLERSTSELLDDPRHHRYFAERLSRAFLGTEDGRFLLFRRDRFVAHLERALARHQPYDALVRELISARGLWTGSPATNFLTVALGDEEIDTAKLAGRTARAFLALRIDCAQCHDHPFADWTKDQFEGLAAFYAPAHVTLLGVHDETSTTARAPSVPYDPELLPMQGTPRERLARWVTDPRNTRFARATVNRVWGLLFGRPYRAPVDELDERADPVLDALAQDFVAHGHDLRRLIRAITSTRAFLASSAAEDDRPELEESFARFPLSPLRPEQLFFALAQAASPRKLGREDVEKLVAAYGELGDDELAKRTGTVAQALLLVNRGKSFEAAGRFEKLSHDHDAALDALFLAHLTRHPTETERVALHDTAIGDVAWALANSAELSWNH